MAFAAFLGWWWSRRRRRVAVRGFSERHAERGGGGRGGGGGGEGHRACRFDLHSKIFDEKKTSKKKKGKRETVLLGFRVYLEKKRRATWRLSHQRTKKFCRFCSRALHAPTHQHHHLQQNPHSMASFRVRSLLSFASRERRDGRAVRVVFLSLLFSRFLSDDSRHRDSDGRSRPRVRSCRGKGCAVDERDEKGRGPRELRRVDIERRVFARPRRGRPSRRSVRGLVFQDLSRAKS